jgi:hypothetical protein
VPLEANMPMLSRQGFIDLGKREYLRNSDVGYTYLKRVVSEYEIWGELGEIPRSALPARGAGEANEERASLPSPGSSLVHATVSRGEKNVDALAKGDDWEQYLTRSLSGTTVDVADTMQAVKLLLQNEGAMKAQCEKVMEKNKTPVFEDNLHVILAQQEAP